MASPVPGPWPARCRDRGQQVQPPCRPLPCPPLPCPPLPCPPLPCPPLPCVRGLARANGPANDVAGSLLSPQRQCRASHDVARGQAAAGWPAAYWPAAY